MAESLPDKIKDRNAVIAGLIIVIILLLLYWRRNFVTVNNQDQGLPPIDPGEYVFQVPGLTVPTIPDNYDWGQTTDLSCGCGGDYFPSNGPVLTPPVYVYVQSPPSPHIEAPALAQLPPAPQIVLPVYTPPPPPTWHVEYGKNVHGEQELYHVGSDGLVFLMGKYSRKGPFASQTKDVVQSGTDYIVDGRRYVHDAGSDHPMPIGFKAGKKGGVLDNAGQLESPIVYSGNATVYGYN